MYFVVEVPKHTTETVKTVYKKIFFSIQVVYLEMLLMQYPGTMPMSLYMRKNMLSIDWQEVSFPDGRREIQTVWCADPFNINLSCLADLVLGILCL